MRNREALVLIPAFFLSVLVAGCGGNRQLVMADQLGSQGRWDEAYQIYQDELKKDPTNFDLRKRVEEVRAKAAKSHYDEGIRRLSDQRVLAALEEIKKAIALEPSREEYQAALATALRKREALEDLEIGRRLVAAEKFSEALERFERAQELDPGLTAVRDAMVELAKAEKKSAEEELNLTLKSNQPITLKFQNAKLSDVFELLSKSAGVNILFDKDVKPETVNLSIFIKDASFREALNLILTTNSLFMKKIGEQTLLVIPKNKQKVDQYQDLMIRTFYLSNVKAKEMINLLRTVLETRRIIVNEDINAVVVRETPEKLALAQKIIEANDRRRAEMLFDVEILEVDENKALQFGWNFTPGSASINIQGSTTPTGTTVAPGQITLTQLKSITDDLILFSLPSIIVDFFKQEAEAKTLAKPRIRAVDGKQAKINIGNRVPILLSTTTTAAAAVGQVPTASTATSIEYKDVGVKLNVEPEIHLAGDVTLKLSLEVTSLGNQIDLGNGNKQYEFGTRTADSVMNVKDGETIVIGGLIQEEESNTVTKVPFLGDIPYFGALFSGINKSTTRNDILLTLTPHLVHGLEVPSGQLQSFWSGTEESYSTRPLFSEEPAVVDLRMEGGKALPSPPPVPAPQAAPPPPVKIWLEPKELVSSVNGEVKVEVRMENAKGISSGRFSVGFDSSLLQFRSGEQGDLLRGGTKAASFAAASQPGSGIIDIQIGQKEPEGISGSGPLFTLYFTGARPGVSRLDLKDVRLLGSGNSQLPTTIAAGSVTIK